MIALTETFAIAAAVSLKAPSMAIALLGSTPLLLGSLGQFFLPAFVDVRHARKPQVLVGVRLQISFLLLAGFAGFFPARYAAWMYVTSVALGGISFNLVTAAWASWMGDLVPMEIRGRHFAWRSRLFALVQLSVAVIAGFSAMGYSTENAPWTFFTAIFVSAGLFRVVSYQLLKRQYEPPVEPTGREREWRVRPGPDLRVFSLAHALMQGAAAMSAPFFTVWFLRDLRFDYFTLALTACSTILGSIVSLPLWGKLVDHFGSRAILRVAGLLVCIAPVPYLVFSTKWAALAISFGGGVSWAGYNLVTFNHLLNASEKQDRARVSAYASAVTGVVVFSMTLLGGFLATRMPVVFRWPLQTLFLVSALVRLSTFSYFFPRLHEYAPPAGRRAQDLFNEMPGYRVGLGLLRNFFRAFRG
jgi:MFS family permease